MKKLLQNVKEMLGIIKSVESEFGEFLNKIENGMFFLFQNFIYKKKKNWTELSTSLDG